MTKYGYLPGESFEAFSARQARQHETGKALGEARAERGEWLTEDERFALTHNMMWGSSSYPVQRLGKKWELASKAAKGTPLYRTKREAWVAWEILLDSWRTISGIESYNRAVAGGL